MSAKNEKVLVLRTCNADMSSAHDRKFIYPKSGPVEAPDWDPDPKRDCGGGLHGLLWGNGDWSLLGRQHDAVWMILEVDPSEGLVPSEGKVRFRRGEVVYCGTQAGAMTRLMCSPEAMKRAQKEAKAWAKENEVVTADKAKATSGYSAHAATAGDYAHAATAGNSAHAATAGNYAHAATAGNYAHAATAGYYAHAATAGDSAHAATAGNYAHAATAGNSAHAATAGYYAHAATAGDSAHAATAGNSAHAATAGYYAHAATAGNSGSSEAKGAKAIAASLGHGGKVKAGADGLLILTWWDVKAKRYRGLVAEVGVDGIKADTWYCASDGKIVEVDAA